MRTITREIAKELVTVGDAQPAVTIYAPMHTTVSPPHISENQIRLKNLVGKAMDEIVKQYGEDHQLAEELSDWLDAVYADLKFWENQTPGLLLCAKAGDIRWFNLSIDTDEYIAIDETFHLAPVLAMLNHDHSYYVLIVAQHNPKLFKGDMYQLRISDIELPTSVQAALGLDEKNQKSENQGSAHGTGMQTGGFNGRGGARNPQEEDRMKFFRIIDRMVCDQAEANLPLILAGVEAETVEYRHISKYPRIMRGTIAGAHVDIDTTSLHNHARTIINQELIQPAHQSIIEEYKALEGTNPGRTAHDIATIQDAIEAGRVEKLLAPLENQTADTIRDTHQSVTKITLPSGENGRLLNRLAAKVWQRSGTVISLTPHEMPHNTPMVASLRY